MGTVTRCCGPFGVLTLSMLNPVKLKWTTVSCCESDNKTALGAVGVRLPNETHSCAKELMDRRIRDIRMVLVFRMIVSVTYFAAKISQKSKTRMERVSFSPPYGLHKKIKSSVTKNVIKSLMVNLHFYEDRSSLR